MMNHPMSAANLNPDLNSDPLLVSDFRLLLPETLWLEPEYFEQAKAISNQFSNQFSNQSGNQSGNGSPLSDESLHWQIYLNELGRLALEAWIKERLPDHPIQAIATEIPEVSYLRVGDFKLCLMAREQVLDEVVGMPSRAIEIPEAAAHFYVVMEVLEEHHQVILRGFLPHDDLMTQIGHTSLNSDSILSTSKSSLTNSEVSSLSVDQYCLLPLASFDRELNHLLVYVQYTDPSVMRSPISAAEPPASPKAARMEALPSFPDAKTARTNLSQWLQGTLEQGWQAIDVIVNPEANLAWGLRHTALGAKGGKLINFGMQLGNQTVMLLVTVTSEAEGKIGISVQVLPAGGEVMLPCHLELTLLSSADKVLQAVQSREHDNYIQLKPFKGKPGTRFSVEVALEQVQIRETFEL